MTSAVAPIDRDPDASDPPPTTLSGLVRNHTREVALGAVLLAVTNVVSALVPQFTRGASNAILNAQGGNGMRYAVGIMVAAIVGAATRVGSRIMLFNAGRNIEYDLRGAILARIHQLGPSFFRRMSSGEVMSRATNDLAQVRLMVGFAALSLFNAIFAYVANIPVMLYRNPLLTVSALAPFPVFILLTRLFAGSMFARSRATQESLGAMSDRLQRTLAGIRVVRAYGLEGAETRAFETLSARSLEANLALARLRGGLMPILGAATAVGSLVVLWVGGRLTVEHRATVGDILAFQGHLALVGWPTIALGYVFSILERGRASLVRIDEVLRARPDIADDHPVPLAHVTGRLTVRGLTWQIEGRTVLDDVSFDVPAGASLAIVGRTGSGKSLLAQLIARMLPTPHGAVFVDERDVTTVPLEQLRRSVCLAQQEAFLFSTTIERNIAFAAPEAETDEAYARALAVADEVQLRGEIETMPDGLDTIVGERGVQLSGGQKQRVALARALLAGPRLLVLDDPLSAVDARTEAAILDAIERAARGRTLVMVTHRITAAARCERVLVLDEGRLVEHGTHAELIALGGTYARMAERQQLEAELEAIA